MSLPGSGGGRRGEGAGPLRRLTVQHWFQLVLAGTLLFVLGCGVVGWQLLARTAAQSDNLTDRLEPARVEMYRLQSALLNQETGLRGFVISGDEQFLEPYTKGLEEERAAADRLRGLVTGDELLAGDVETLADRAGDWRRQHAVPLIEDARAGESVPEGESAELRASKTAFDGLRTLFAEQNRHLRDTRNAARSELEDVRTTRDWVFAAMLSAFLLTGATLAALLRRTVGRPLGALRESSQRVADGEFGRRIAVVGPADVRAVAVAVDDMRERIATELAASRSREELLARQAAGLDAQAVELRRSNAELEQFAYVASHDLQEPLRKVASFCQLLDKRYGGELDERAKQYIDFAVDGAKRMQILINDLLTFSRVGRVNDEREPVDLGEVLDRALLNLSAAIEESGAVVERPADLPEVTGDVTSLTMLWQNLIGNAVKFRAPGRTPRIAVTVEPEPGAGALRFCVTDNGIGIPPEFGEKVFVIFQRLHGREEYSGTGIGLALCKKIAEHHGGRIFLDAGPAEGTRICFTLPDPAAPAVPFPVPAAALAAVSESPGARPAAVPEDASK